MADPEVYIISHSSAESHSRCEWAHHYSYGYGVSLKEQAEHLQIGKCFHQVVAGYYGALKLGMGWEEARNAGREVWRQHMMERKYDLEVLSVVIDLFDKYAGYYNHKEWEILWVEEYMEYKVTDNIILNGEIDLVIRCKNRHSKHYGKLGIVDHKTCFNFMTQNELGTHSQIPKYIFAMNMMDIFGETIQFGIINQIRWRSVKDVNKLFSRLELDHNEVKEANFINEYIKQCKRIIPKKQLPDPYFWKDVSNRTTIKDICKYCDYSALCIEELEGTDSTRTMEAFYAKKDYSYRAARKRVNGKPIEG